MSVGQGGGHSAAQDGIFFVAFLTHIDFRFSDFFLCFRAQRGMTGLCLVPLCSSGCGSGGHCIKPSLCVCDGGKIAPRYQKLIQYLCQN